MLRVKIELTYSALRPDNRRFGGRDFHLLDLYLAGTAVAFLAGFLTLCAARIMNCGHSDA